MSGKTTDEATLPAKNGRLHDFFVISSKIPVVGPYLDALGNVSDSTLRTLIFLFFTLLVYPIFSFFIVIFLLTLAPTSFQTKVRDFVLQALGVGGATDKAINQSNQMIDAEVPLTFTLDGHEVYYQQVSASQKIIFSGIVQKKVWRSSRRAVRASLTIPVYRLVF